MFTRHSGQRAVSPVRAGSAARRRSWCRQSMRRLGWGLGWGLVIACSSSLAHAADGAPGSGVAGSARNWRHSEQALRLPADLLLLRHDGRRQSLAQALDDGRPVVVAFLPPRCSGGPCAAGNQLLADFRARIGSERDEINMISFSLDVDRDDPAASAQVVSQGLAQQARRLPGGAAWPHIGVARADLPAMLKAFGIAPTELSAVAGITLLRPAPGKAWHRYEGPGTAAQLVDEYMLHVHGGELCLDPNLVPTSAGRP
ncbi:MAG: hypothetical protein RL722_82 [Pseudomonadota bacterium]